ncbi:HAD family hydrolase [Mastigocoleus testarum]|uniref:Haloacid dehalogenase n=1 Tax=Mastigocoleus testarum BC008 TaxID=371196 RepID=A0A0V7ZT79_9CYAN|nr:HAD family hydrolase [Mastigocoleus testarum]KST67853.1 haloacid dehalogenase [Mastigocoleus testarum BC008]
MLRIVTDFDGPIVDVSQRYYRVYQLCLEKTCNPEQQIKELSFSEFWTLKRSHIPEKKIGILSGLSDTQAEEFAQLRKQMVHTHPYFQRDTIQPGAIDALLKVQQAGCDLVVMTMRRISELNYALVKDDLGRFFPEHRRYCLSDDYMKTQDVRDKPLLMKRALAELPPATDTWMIGDTEADIAAAKKYGIKVIAVDSGIRDRTQLELYQPNYYLPSLADAIDFILQTSASSLKNNWLLKQYPQLSNQEVSSTSSQTLISTKK